MFLRCIHFLVNLSLNVLINMVLTQKRSLFPFLSLFSVSVSLSLCLSLSLSISISISLSLSISFYLSLSPSISLYLSPSHPPLSHCCRLSLGHTVSRFHHFIDCAAHGPRFFSVGSNSDWTLVPSGDSQSGRQQNPKLDPPEGPAIRCQEPHCAASAGLR